MDNINISIMDKLSLLNNYFDEQVVLCSELKKFSKDISAELNNLKYENAKCYDVIQSQNLLISQLNMLLLKIKEIDDDSFVKTLHSNEIDLNSITLVDQIH